MSRTKHKVSKCISPDNSPEENKRLAQLGEMGIDPMFDAVWTWRFRSALYAWESRQPKATVAAAGQRNAEELEKEIAATIGKAIAGGNWKLLERLAKLTRFVHENFDWKADSIWEFSERLRFKGAKIIDPVRATIAHEYFFHINAALDAKKKSRKTFMPHVAAMLRRDCSAGGPFERQFDRACKALGIEWPKR
jgi:hypothetical protein